MGTALEKFMDHHRVNFEALQKLSGPIFQSNLGKFALIRDGNIVSYFDTNRAALGEGRARYADGRFSVMRVEPQLVDMGFADCAAYPR